MDSRAVWPRNRTLAKLWQDQSAFIITIELILIATITVIGLIVGLTAIRDALVSEMDDIAQAITNLDWGDGTDGEDPDPGAGGNDSCLSFSEPPEDEI